MKDPKILEYLSGALLQELRLKTGRILPDELHLRLGRRTEAVVCGKSVMLEYRAVEGDFRIILEAATGYSLYAARDADSAQIAAQREQIAAQSEQIAAQREQIESLSEKIEHLTSIQSEAVRETKKVTDNTAHLEKQVKRASSKLKRTWRKP